MVSFVNTLKTSELYTFKTMDFVVRELYLNKNKIR